MINYGKFAVALIVNNLEVWAMWPSFCPTNISYWLCGFFDGTVNDIELVVSGKAR